MRILFLSHTHVHGPFRVGSHHYARELSALGHDVVHLSTPVSTAHIVLGRGTRERPPVTSKLAGDDTRYIVPTSTLPAGIGAFDPMAALRKAGEASRFDVVLLDQPLLWHPRVRDAAGILVYRPTDEYPSGIKARRQTALLRHVDAVVATSGQVLSALGPVSLPSEVIENGVDYARFASDGTTAREKVAVYVGALDDRFDWTQLSRWATSHADWVFRVIGPVSTRPDRLPPNVDLTGPADYSDIPGLLSSPRIGLLPLSDHVLNRGRSPMKRYEYLAAGLTVIARGTPAIVAEPDVGLLTYDGAEEAEEAFSHAARGPAFNAAGVERAGRESWTSKAKRLEDLLTTWRGSAA